MRQMFTCNSKQKYMHRFMHKDLPISNCRLPILGMKKLEQFV